MSPTVTAVVFLGVGILIGWAWPLPKSPSDGLDELLATRRKAKELSE